MKDETRITLIDRVKAGSDETAWQEFSAIYERYLYLIVRGLGAAEDDADDLVQECLLAIWKALGTYEYGKNGARFRTWAAVVARRVVIANRRRADCRIKTTAAADELLASESDECEEPAFYDFIEREWRTYLVNLAFERIRPHFSGKAIEVFEASLAGESLEVIGKRLELQQDSIRKLRGRVGKRLEQEISQLRADLE